MTMFRTKIFRKLTAEQLSTRVLYALVCLCAVVFALFWLVGYDIPFDDEPEFNAPLLTDTLLLLVYALVAVACFIALCSMVSRLRQRSAVADEDGSSRVARRTGTVVAALLVVVTVATFALGSTDELLVNGEPYRETFWLRLTDMFINTSLLLMLVAAVAVAVGLSGLGRKLKGRK